jgi:hypothetical protein
LGDRIGYGLAGAGYGCPEEERAAIVFPLSSRALANGIRARLLEVASPLDRIAEARKLHAQIGDSVISIRRGPLSAIREAELPGPVAKDLLRLNRIGAVGEVVAVDGRAYLCMTLERKESKRSFKWLHPDDERPSIDIMSPPGDRKDARIVYLEKSPEPQLHGWLEEAAQDIDSEHEELGLPDGTRVAVVTPFLLAVLKTKAALDRLRRLDGAPGRREVEEARFQTAKHLVDLGLNLELARREGREAALRESLRRDSPAVHGLLEHARQIQPRWSHLDPLFELGTGSIDDQPLLLPVDNARKVREFLEWVLKR